VADLTEPQHLQAVQKALGAPTAAYVTLDAPCSALGTLRRHPELRERQEDAIERLAALQAVLLDQAARLVAVGGVLVYAVCTWTTAEGPHQVAQFLRRHPEFELDALPASHRAFDSHGFFRTWPHRHQLDGFFAARLVRRAAILREPRAIP
jgi:16S rRNA (cytosine967-C5)-methyltransferase